VAEGIPIVAVFADPDTGDKNRDRTTIHVEIGSKPLN
jgi:hypothetical protein